MKRWIFALALALAALAYFSFTLYVAIEKNEFLATSIQAKQLGLVWQETFRSPEQLEQSRPYLGSQDAPLTIVHVVDFTSREAAAAYDSVERLKNEAVDAGQTRLYHRYIISKQDYVSGNGSYLLAKAAVCYNNQSWENTTGFHRALIQGMLPSEAAREFGLDQSLFEQCLSASPKFLYYDMLDTEEFQIMGPSLWIGIDGGKNAILYGSPTNATIDRQMRIKQVRVGI